MQSLGFLEVVRQQVGEKTAHRHERDGLLAFRIVDPAAEQCRQAWTDAAGNIDGITDHGVSCWFDAPLKNSDCLKPLSN